MTKKRSKSLFVLFSILLVVCLIACFVNFTYPLAIKGNYYSYSNFVSNLKLGEDISSSLKIIYSAKPTDNETTINYEELRNATMQDLKDIVIKEGYKDVSIAAYGEQGVVIQIGNLLTDEDKNIVESLIGNPATISFSTESDGSNPFAGAKHVKSVEPMQQTLEDGSLAYVVVLQFEDEYASMIEEKSSGKTVYIYMGKTKFAELDYGTGAITNGVIYLQSSTFESILDAKTCANQIRTGMLSLPLTQISSECSSASYGEFATLLLTIAMGVIVLAAFVFLIIKYRHMGWLMCFNLLFFITIGLFLLQSIPLVHINFAGVIGMMICFILAIDSLLSIIEKAKENYQSGAQLHIAFREAQKSSLFKILFLNALVLVTGFICLLMPVQAVQSFGWVALVLSIVSTFINLAMMKLFINMYLALNNDNGKKCNFHKGGKNA